MAASIAVLHPGQMGVAVAATLKNSGNEVWWVSQGRRQPTRDRAVRLGLKEARSLGELRGSCSVIVSVCPPEFASQQAEGVFACGWRGLYIDANAISPEHVCALAERMRAAGVDFVDAGIIGLPPTERGQCWMHLSGPRAAEAAALFHAGPMETNLAGAEICQASALKMCFAGFNKGSTALLCAVLATAQHYGVSEHLKQQWTSYGPKLSQVQRQISIAAPKAWRWVQEMREISATFAAAGLPPEFHQAAAKLFSELAGFKDCPEPDLAAVLGVLTRAPPAK